MGALAVAQSRHSRMEPTDAYVCSEDICAGNAPGLRHDYGQVVIAKCPVRLQCIHFALSWTWLETFPMPT